MGYRSSIYYETAAYIHTATASSPLISLAVYQNGRIAARLAGPINTQGTKCTELIQVQPFLSDRLV
jgi:hypothetical protein